MKIRRKRNRFRNYLSLEALVVVLVILAFKVIPDKKMASMLTSALFILSTLAIIYWESRYPDFQKRPSFWGAVTFLVVSALPIFAVRLIYWDLPFDEIRVGGITGAEMHKISNYVFILMLVSFFIDSYLAQVKAREDGEL